VCTNSVGSFGCSCAVGFLETGEVCNEIDECALGTHTCGENELSVCANTAGSFLCSCKPGWTWDQGGCASVNECSQGLHNCAQSGGECTDTVGSFTCICAAELIGDGFKCAGKTVAPIAVGASVSGVIVVFLAFFVFWWRRRLSSSNLQLSKLRNMLHDLARVGFSREYRHNINNSRAFALGFEQLQLPHKSVQLGRELARMGSTGVYKALMLPEKRQVAVHCHKNKSLESQSLLLCDAMVLHLFRHENILALLHVCRLLLEFCSFLFCSHFLTFQSCF
jgi:hypothetical protein